MKTYLLCFFSLLCSHLSAQTKSVEIPLSANAYLTQVAYSHLRLMNVSPRQPDGIGENGINPRPGIFDPEGILEVPSMMKEKSDRYARVYTVYFGTTVKTSGKVYLKLKASKYMMRISL